jgi:NADH-ubiquinone oxidoreductase chain 5
LYGLSIYLGLEWMVKSLIFVLILFLVTFFVILFSLMYMNYYLFYFVFIVLIILFVVSIVLFLISERNHFLFFSWDILGIISFLLVIFYNNWVSLSGSLETLMSNRLGDLFLIFLLVMGNWSLKTSGLMFLFNFLLVLASWTKRVQFPFHGWLVKAMEAPTPVSSLVHSSTLVTVGFFINDFGFFIY